MVHYSLCHLFLITNVTEFANFADNNTPYTTADTIHKIVQSLEYASMILFNCHFLVNKENEPENIKCEKLLGIKVNTKLNFSEYINYIINKATCKVPVLSRVKSYLSFSKTKILANMFVTQNLVTSLY